MLRADCPSRREQPIYTPLRPRHPSSAMCNLYTQSKSVDEIAAIFRNLQMPLSYPEGIPNLAPRDIAITDPAPIVRASASEPGSFELVVRRWSWPRPQRQARLQLQVGRSHLPVGPLPRARRRLLRVHQARRPEAEDQEPLALHPHRAPARRHRRPGPNQPASRRSLHFTDRRARRRRLPLPPPPDHRPSARNAGAPGSKAPPNATSSSPAKPAR